MGCEECAVNYFGAIFATENRTPQNTIGTVEDGPDGSDGLDRASPNLCLSML